MLQHVFATAGQEACVTGEVTRRSCGVGGCMLQHVFATAGQEACATGEVARRSRGVGECMGPPQSQVRTVTTVAAGAMAAPWTPS